LFADDSIFFARSDRKSVMALSDTLWVYCEGSGQKINLDKSSVFWGNICTDQVKDEVKNLLGVVSEVLNDLYLGIPTFVSQSSTATFNFILERIWRCING
jgi:hypothetical protein